MKQNMKQNKTMLKPTTNDNGCDKAEEKTISSLWQHHHTSSGVPPSSAATPLPRTPNRDDAGGGGGGVAAGVRSPCSRSLRADAHARSCRVMSSKEVNVTAAAGVVLWNERLGTLSVLQCALCERGVHNTH